MEVDKDVLISKVFLKSMIWDKRLKTHANRKLVDNAWIEIAAEMGVQDDGALRKKWKYLRDQFSIELGKIQPSRSGDPGGHTESKWPHFKSLMFLTDIVKPRVSARNLVHNATVVHQENASDVIPHPAENGGDGSEDEDVNTSSTQIQILQEKDDEPTGFPRKRKRSDLHSKYNEQILTIERKKAALLEQVIQDRRCDNDDALFFRSLLPYVAKIPETLKLRFRSRVQELVDEYISVPEDTAITARSDMQRNLNEPSVQCSVNDNVNLLQPSATISGNTA